VKIKTGIKDRKGWPGGSVGILSGYTWTELPADDIFFC